ncbi:hypothetical protein [Microlunatus speluncae]|uniref:hypothetical protein n=1 Tax=Microlunatus speluncae TaxID=2594267 RepID=UPI0012667D5F|nr:hypothetical protein [Microlunatus speluncae]
MAMNLRSVTWILSLAAIIGNSMLIVLAMALGFHIGSSLSALANSAKGQAMAYLAVPGLILSIIAHVLNGRATTSGRGTAGPVITIIALACGLISLTLFLALPWH